MKNKFLLAVCLLLSVAHVWAQNNASSPYELDWSKDGVWIGAGLAATTTGFLLIQNKDGFTEEELMELDKDDINFLDRSQAGYYDENLSTISDIPFYTSFALPFSLLLSERTEGDAGTLGVMYLEALSTTAGMFTIAAGLTNRARPRTYSSELPLIERMESTNTRSFYSGHVAASATATFFTARVYLDYYPDSNNKWLVWTGAASIPAAIGVLRTRGGNHFITDTVLGYMLGAAVGYFTPVLHRAENDGFSLHQRAFMDLANNYYQTIGVNYTF